MAKQVTVRFDIFKQGRFFPEIAFLCAHQIKLTFEEQHDVTGGKINMNTARSLISPVLEYASSFNRFDYSSVYISLTPSCLPSYQAGELMSCRMPNRLKLFPGNEQEMQSQVLHNRIMSPFQSFWWGIWTKAKIIRPMPTVCPGINSLYTQWSVKRLFFFPWFCLFLSSCGFFEREACLFRDKPRLLCCSSPLSLIHKPDGSSSSSTFSFCLFFFFFFALQFEFSASFSFSHVQFWI